MSDVLGRWMLLGAMAAAGLAGCGKDDGQKEPGASSAPATPPVVASAPTPAPPAEPAPAPAPATDLPPQSAAAVFAGAGLPDTLIKYGCYSCHDVDGVRIGPPLRAVAGLYRSNPQALDTLTQKTLHGGGGVWGPMPMIAHPHLTAEQVRPMIEAILKLN